MKCKPSALLHRRQPEATEYGTPRSPSIGLPAGQIIGLTIGSACVNYVQYSLNDSMNRTKTAEWMAVRRSFIEAGGHTTQLFGLGRILGQLYSLLYLSPRPLCLDEIVEELGVSKASVSTTVRQLERGKAVKRVWIRGDRRDFYEAETDFQLVLKQGVLATLRKKLETAGTQLAVVESCLNEVGSNGGHDKDMEVLEARLKKAKQFHSQISSLLGNPLVDHLL